MKVDLYNHENKFNSWKSQLSDKGYTEPELTKSNSSVLIEYVLDMERGANISLNNKKGSRSYARLNTLRQKIAQLMRMLQERGINDITKVKEQQIQDFFSEMRNGTIKTKLGKKYKSVADYVKIFKAFWHWHQKVNRKNKKLVDDLTIELDSSIEEKPKWVHLDDNQMKLILEKCEARYKPLLSFLYDSGARVTETLSLLVQDIHQEKGIIYANIREETSKTFGRKIKLLLCGKDLIEYIKRSEAKPTDRLFNFTPKYVNDYLGILAKELLGEGNSKAGAKYSELTMYDFRHNSACYWVVRYKNSQSLQYRFGWKTEKYILYYTEFLGMRDLIQEDDLYVDITKTELERRIETQQKEIEKLQETVKLILEVKDFKKDFDLVEIKLKKEN